MGAPSERFLIYINLPGRREFRPGFLLTSVTESVRIILIYVVLEAMLCEIGFCHLR